MAQLRDSLVDGNSTISTTLITSGDSCAAIVDEILVSYKKEKINMKIILNNNIELLPIMVSGTHTYIQGVNRDTLTFVFNDMSMDELDKVFNEINCEHIAIIEDNGDEYIHSGYVIRTELSKKSVIVEREAGEMPEVTENRVFVTMAQRTYAEYKMMSLEEEILVTQLATAELAESMMEV